MGKKRTHELTTEEIAFIHGYLRDELSDTDREIFDFRMKTEPEWRSKMEEVTLLVLGVQEANLAGELAQWQVDLIPVERGRLTQPRTATASPSFRWWWIAASAVLLAVAMTWFLWPKMDTPERLYLTFYTPDIGLPVEMSAADESRYRFYDGMISYKEGNYTDALTKWERVAPDIVPSDTVAYYQAMAHMGLAEISTAIDLLTGIVADGQSAFQNDALWYLALCHLWHGDTEKSIAQLQQIPHDDRARQLLERLQ